MINKNRSNKNYVLIFALVVITVFFLSTKGLAIEDESSGNYGIWSLIPPLLAITLAMVLREAVISLFIGVWAGATILNNGNFWSAIEKTATTMIGSVADSWNASILLFFFFVGGLLAMLFFSGGGKAFLEILSEKVHNSKMAQLVPWLSSIAIFIDDYANIAFRGALFRSLSDKYHISREKFSYILDSTAAPVASIFLISTWIGYQVGLIGDAIPAGATTESAYSLWFGSIPYSFYSILALLLVGIIGFTGRDFGPMLKAEYRARTTNELWAKDSRPLAGSTADIKIAENAKPKAINLWLPLVILILLSFFFMWVSGGGSEAESISQAISDADSMFAIFLATLVTFIVAIIMYVVQKIAPITEIMDSFMNGARTMIYASLILILAWSIGSITEELGTADFVIGAVGGNISPTMLPIFTFLISAFIAFATGTSWGTMAIVVPIVIPLAFFVGTEVHIAISAILTGAVMGDHCSPISDTTVMSSTFAGSDHIDHVKTQLPYGILVALTAIVCYLLVGWGIPVIFVLLIGIVLLFIVFQVLSSMSANQLGIKFPLPEFSVEKMVKKGEN